MLQNILQTFQGSFNSAAEKSLHRMYCHCDIPTYMIHQKVVEQNRRAVYRNTQQLVVGKHAFDDDLNVLWSAITAHQAEKVIFASFYVWVASIDALVLGGKIQASTRPRSEISLMEIFLCDANMILSEDARYAH